MIDVAFTRAELREADVAVVVDVLRATSTLAQALASGYEAVLCADSVERARGLRGGGRALAGEQRCIRPSDFDLGNSPLEATRRYAERLVLASTNGSTTIVAATRHAPVVLAASLLNLAAVLSALNGPRWSGRDVQVVCSGTSGALALEDVYVAGRLCVALGGPRTDAARTAEALVRAYPDPEAALNAGAHAAVLTRAGLGDDVAYCARVSRLDVPPRVVATAAGVATVVDDLAAPATLDAMLAVPTRAGSPAGSSGA